MCVLIFCATFVWNISHSEKNRVRYDQKCISVFKWRARFSSQLLINLEFSRKTFEKYLNKKFNENPFKWINQPDAAISRVYYLSFRYSSTCFGHPHAHHQELNNCSIAVSGLPLERGGNSAVGRDRAGRNMLSCITTSNKPEKLLHLVGWFNWMYDDDDDSRTCKA